MGVGLGSQGKFFPGILCVLENALSAGYLRAVVLLPHICSPLHNLFYIPFPGKVLASVAGLSLSFFIYEDDLLDVACWGHSGSGLPCQQPQHVGGATS